MKFSSKKEEKHYYQHIASEQEFLEWYKKQERPTYQKPSVTVDMVLLCYNKETDQIKVLLIQRRGHPYRNSWALPGGFITPNESTGDSVIRETKEETGVTISAKNIEQLHTFSTPDRDPRGWVITVSYLAFIGEAVLSAGDDANQARWFSLERKGNQLYLTSGEVEIILDLQTQESLGEDTLAFDHSQIIIKAFNRITNKMTHEPQVLQVLGESFTITEARKVFAKFWGIDYHTIDHSNFKKSLMGFLDEVGERPSGVGRPSKLYQLKENFYEN
ncbi:NUDIX hydrolase [Tetragenococcus koreensis]|uniref:NUDIX family hydrolase n=2 Tax=Enterococcaceae TaxID=81852 RepID=A0AAN4UC17_9ENTE|nr:NUDIX domain-containing protein [Tetragenococcus koreensis]AYW45724.1 NUDIX hydrolase [Tetragenococcus koreensis]MCF1585532.1 NUDIX hydrolase [Tetragenococcus koreensis]MCF1615078.1 NUDIX hydrolase [Tetragenococcus koreensis]MCF1616912.1 NUDIX hydrolase [Tetragenococcus koreensis]MCF1620123.1 NUDIX hydrolase [Tetragenococcus koreensis]